MKIEYEDRNCVVCNRVYVNNILVDIPHLDDGVSIVCIDCAMTIRNFVESIRKAGESKGTL